MQRITKRRKYYIVSTSAVQQRILLEEMKSRFTSLLVLESANYLECKVIQDHISKMRKVLDEDKKKIDEFHKDHSHFDAFLLAWGVSSGAMHNHEALCAHTDANKSHPVETLTLYPKMPDSDAVYRTSRSDLTSGYLSFPLYGFNIELECGFSVIHSSLQKTVHLPDHSRSMSNWSKVHGP